MTAPKSTRFVFDAGLEQFATSRQAEFLKEYGVEKSFTAVARKLKLNESTVRDALHSLTINAAIRGYSPRHDMTHTVPDPFVVKGASTNYSRDPETGEMVMTQQWVKSGVDNQRRHELALAAYASVAKTLPRIDPVKPPKAVEKDLLNVFTLTDCHLGMYAWSKEGGEVWNIAEAERVVTGCFQRMVELAPQADSCVIAQLGDFLHYDGLTPVTPTSGHILDTDVRFGELAQTAIKVIRRVIKMALERHKHVYLLIAEGNHDMASSIWMRELFKALYENEPRIKIIDNDLPYYAMQWGEVMLAWHHSHLKKMEQLPLFFAAEFPKMWGDSKVRFGHSGDKHHLNERDMSGMRWMQHPTLAARDAYASRHGWHALREATGITYHKKNGQVFRSYVSPDMIL